MVDAEDLFDLRRQQRIADQIGSARFQSMLVRLAERIEASIANTSSLSLSPAGLSALRAEAHAIAGLASNFGAVSLAASARDLEQACTAGDHAAIGAAIDAYSQVAKKTLSILRP
jgi:HPt (histidine-containing phosphotransfer) domain-containing protein